MQDDVVWLYNAPTDKCRVIYNGVWPKKFDVSCVPGMVKTSISVHPMAPMILFAGRVVYQKGVDILIEAIPHVLNHVPTAIFVFASDGEMRWDLERATKTRNLQRTTLVGQGLRRTVAQPL